MTKNIQGKVVIVTGASSGLGAATARRLAADGAKLVLAARRVEQLKKLADELGLPESAAIQVDVSARAQVQALVEQTMSLHGRIDVLLNNAGIMPLSLLEQARLDEWDALIDVNIKGVLYGIAAVLPHMKKQRSGHIINVASVAALRVTPSSSVYSATKAAVRVISEGVRQEGKEYGIRSTVLCPGAVDSELTQSVKVPEMAQSIQGFYERFAIPAEHFAEMVAFAIEQPEWVDVNEVVFRPTAQNL